jgi:NAD(P)-dependent dehydrogenase (short-subunit alcohol dehydrogenase family)
MLCGCKKKDWIEREADCRRLVDEAIAAFGGLHILVNTPVAA